MGTFSQRITLYGAAANGTSPSRTVEALVDTGAHFSVIPARLLGELGVTPFRRVPVKIADGSVRDWDMGQVEAELDGQRTPILVLLGSDDAPPLLGAHGLEAFLVVADPIEKKLVRREAFLMTA